MSNNTKAISIGSVTIGGVHPVAVQSMTNTKTEDVKATIEQIEMLEAAGCELIRVAVPTREAIASLPEIKRAIDIPLIADIHFHWEFAIAAIEAGVDKIRINPGNIGDQENVAKIVEKAREYDTAIRIGVNSGSLHPKYAKEDDGAEALVNSCLEYISFCEQLKFFNIVLSVKSSSVVETIHAYRKLSGLTEYPLHLGVTESGSLTSGTIKSAVGIGTLLAEGIGDTIRVSLTADPVNEVKVAYQILKALELRDYGPDIISCPTCGRCEIELISLVEGIESRLVTVKHPIKVAIMGCAVNGPGEAKEADIGLAGSKNEGILFKKGKVVKRVDSTNMVEELMDEIEKLIEDVEGAKD